MDSPFFSHCLLRGRYLVHSRNFFSVMASVMLLGGCAEQAPSSGTSQRILAPEEAPLSPAFQGIPDRQFVPLLFREASPAAKLATEAVGVKKLISAQKGGQLKLEWRSKGENGTKGAKVKVEVKILPGALDQDTEISIDLENPALAMVRVDFTFGPHGAQFNIPAQVKMDFEGLDLSGYDDPEAIDLYWYNPESGAWFPVSQAYKKIDLARGKVQGLWYFEHFSVYSLSGGGIK